MKKSTIKHARTCVYNVNYHIVWSVKDRRKVFTTEIECYLKDLFQEIAQEREFEVAMMEVGEQDHIHVFASAHPKIAPSYIVKMLKGISARKLFLKFPQLKKRLWGGVMKKARYYLLRRREKGFGSARVVYRYELIRWNELHKWQRCGWKVIV